MTVPSSSSSSPASASSPAASCSSVAILPAYPATGRVIGRTSEPVNGCLIGRFRACEPLPCPGHVVARSAGSAARNCRSSDLALVSPPVALALDVFARILAEIGCADDDDLEPLRASLVAPPRTRRDAHRVPLLELDDLVVELHPPAPAHDSVHLLLPLLRVAVRKAIAGRNALVAQAGLLELECLGRQTELQIPRAVEVGPDVLQVLLEVPERERHGRILGCLTWLGPDLMVGSLSRTKKPRTRRALLRHRYRDSNPGAVVRRFGATSRIS